MPLEGRTAIVTGAGGGLGREHALYLARKGAKVLVNDLGQEAAEAVAAEIRTAGGTAIAVAGSVADAAAVEAVVDAALAEWGRIDILVNNAGILRDRSFGKMSLEEFRQVLDVHLVGAAICCKAVWDTMRAQRYGRIVMTTSSSGLWGNFGQANYGAAKMALVGLMQTLAIEGAKYGITVNSLAPTAYTRMMEGILPQEQLDALDPRLVSPALLPLVVEDAPTRAIVCAGAGHFARAHVALTQGRYIGGGDDAGERLIAAWDAVSSTQGQVIPGYGFTQAEREIASARAHAGADAPA
ncbi:NAD(P)-dependent dehydrogenase (short-subunit alcohol dehydrogenase family) [Luteimonas sp. J16]|jgi:NAD(P)-dependent dehydrogenase (short-subunit alcohol dehydrogenase family)|uniref:SDR family NAD(P)-dependent oxidoreductase n=1 Tax=unclassified Luteimonas TaxID=2629088 RepID=UPI00047AE98B|nr:MULTISPECIES: SDR family NAD(P)-dependent oxidoreductase [unclassified Luteimonas]TWG94378.1 NAD(P)-dependent dehydrogenase (short-subunit alcohol dehydrogenase family) [Luteimonas sp. J16]